MPKRERRRSQTPPRPTDPNTVAEILNDVDTEVATLFSDDPVLGIGAMAGDADQVPPRVPVVLFELRRGVGQQLPDGRTQEVQAEAIIQAGFARWRPVVTFEQLPDWSVRQTTDGLELWDSGGIWACGAIKADGRWIHEATQLGAVLAVYGLQLGVAAPVEGTWELQDRKDLLLRSRQAGIVAAALVTWQSLPIPDTVEYGGPSYDAATGAFRVGETNGGKPVHWQLHTPGETVHHGLIVVKKGPARATYCASSTLKHCTPDGS